MDIHKSYSMNSSNGVILGSLEGSIQDHFKGDTRNLDFGSDRPLVRDIRKL